MTNEITWRLENENIGRLLVHYAIPAVIGTIVDRRGSRYKGLHSSRP